MLFIEVLSLQTEMRKMLPQEVIGIMSSCVFWLNLRDVSGSRGDRIVLKGFWFGENLILRIQF